MNIKIKAAALLSGVGLLLATVTEADAATVRVRCEKRANRSVISVDGNDLVPGSYRCKVISGSNKARTALQDTLGDELECDFSSRARDNLAGATAISPGFIQNGQVIGKIIDANGNTVISDTENCTVR